MQDLSPKVKSRRKQRVLLVDDHTVLREGLAMVINQQPDLEVCGEAAEAPQALEEVTALKPDVAVVDLSLTTGSGLELIKDMKVLRPELPILVLSLYDESLYAERVLRAGARGYIMKRASTAELLNALRKVVKGGVYLSENVSSLIVNQTFGDTARANAPGRVSIELLSDRELEVFQMLGNGYSTHEIAGMLNLSMKTISCYRQNIKNKLKLKDATEMIQHAVHWADDLRKR